MLVQQKADTYCITDKDYTLVVDPEPHTGFSVKCLVRQGTTSLYITSRDHNEYAPCVYSHPIRKDAQYVEIGAGLGGFTPHLVRKGVQMPIVIEPANYHIIATLLEHARTLPLTHATHGRIDEILARCHTITDASKVRWINATLEDALTHTDLLGCADIVVDHCGAVTYAPTNYSAHRLKKQTGTMLISRTGLMI